MKKILRYLFFSLISFYFTQLIYFPFLLNREALAVFYLLAICAVVTLFSRTFFKVIRFPSAGFGFLVLNILVHSVAIYLGEMFLLKYRVFSLNFPKFDLFGIIQTPVVYLNQYTSIILFSAIYCLIFGFLYFISWNKEIK
jgi:hypothetical protein